MKPLSPFRKPSSALWETFLCVKEVNFMLALKKSSLSPSGKHASKICYTETPGKVKKEDKNFYFGMRRMCHILLLGFFIKFDLYAIPRGNS